MIDLLYPINNTALLLILLQAITQILLQHTLRTRRPCILLLPLMALPHSPLPCRLWMPIDHVLSFQQEIYIASHDLWLGLREVTSRA